MCLYRPVLQDTRRHLETPELRERPRAVGIGAVESLRIPLHLPSRGHPLIFGHVVRQCWAMGQFPKAAIGPCSLLSPFSVSQYANNIPCLCPTMCSCPSSCRSGLTTMAFDASTIASGQRGTPGEPSMQAALIMEATILSPNSRYCRGMSRSLLES